MNINDNKTATADANIQNIPGPPVPVYHNDSWKLLSQGAEARIWLVPNFIQYDFSPVMIRGNHKSNDTTSSSRNETNVGTDTNLSVTSTVICKERFPKAYRHPLLDETLTKSRTKAEAKNLTRCRRGGVSVPLILGVDLNTGNSRIAGGTKSLKVEEKEEGVQDNKTTATPRSACLFMEYIPGCTVRSFLNILIKQPQQQHQNCNNIQRRDCEENQLSTSEEEPCAKKQKISESDMDMSSTLKYVTRLDEYATKVAYQIGVTVAKMHNVNIVHGDLTTSNMILRNSSCVPEIPISTTNTPDESINNSSQHEWTPDIVLIDFGLSSTSVNTKKTSSHEERAVDLYVLERSFVTTHVGSEELVKEIMRGYKATCQSSDSVFVRLAQVRLRGRKRECFG